MIKIILDYLYKKFCYKKKFFWRHSYNDHLAKYQEDIEKIVEVIENRRVELRKIKLCVNASFNLNTREVDIHLVSAEGVELLASLSPEIEREFGILESIKVINYSLSQEEVELFRSLLDSE